MGELTEIISTEQGFVSAVDQSPVEVIASYPFTAQSFDHEGDKRRVILEGITDFHTAKLPSGVNGYFIRSSKKIYPSNEDESMGLQSLGYNAYALTQYDAVIFQSKIK